MPTIVLPLDPRRRVMVPVEISVPTARARALLQGGRAVPPPRQLLALVDTGASRTCLDHQFRQTLNLRAVSSYVLTTPAGLASSHLYKVNLVLLHPSGNPQQHLMRSAYNVAAAQLHHVGADMVIGRDILAVCSFLYDGRAGTFQLDY